MADTQTHSTQDHKEIQNWVEERDGTPCTVEGTDDNNAGLLRISFGRDDDNLKKISWDDFFKKFDDENLEFLYQNENKDGGRSNFNKLVNAS